MRHKAAALLGALLLAGPAFAQATHCRLPDRLPDWQVAKPDGMPRHARVAGYSLALSWSPEYCRRRADDPASGTQCGGGNRFGFVLHGLWPEAGGREYPQWCGAVGRLPETLVRQHLCMTPSPQLLQHEWQKHGSCGWSDPARYFRAASILWSAVRLPDLRALSRRAPDAGAIRSAFAQANRGLPARAVGVFINRRGWLTEVRLCLDKGFRPLACPAGRGGVADATPVSIWRGG